ncbi:MAG: lytic transglycosylase domain-containing protein [Candidatus Xenobia bacterium]
MPKRLLLLLLGLLLCVPTAWADPASDAHDAFVARAHMTPTRQGTTLSGVIHHPAGLAGQAVDMRGMARDVKTDDQGLLTFKFKVGPDQATVTGPPPPFALTDGDSIRLLARIKKAGPQPELEMLAAMPAVYVDPGLGTHWNPDVVTPQQAAAVSGWYQWILEFNPHLARQTAGNYAATIFRLSRVYRVDPRLVLSVVAAESAFNPDAVSKVGAIGLGQLMPDTAVTLGVRNIHDPNQNLEGCIKYLAIQIHRWGRSPDALARVLAAYNAGEGAVVEYNGVPPYAETLSYVRYVSSLYHELGGMTQAHLL